MLEYISDLESTGNYKPAEIIPIHVIRERKVFYNTVSAGTGSFLDGDEYEIFSSPDIPEAATFGVYVDGDSMEPKYHNFDNVRLKEFEPDVALTSSFSILCSHYIYLIQLVFLLLCNI